MDRSYETPEGVEVLDGQEVERFKQILTPEALAFVAALQRGFGERRTALLAKRVVRQAALDAGTLPDFLEETRKIREGDWMGPAIPEDLRDRRVEITGPPDRKMVINALNSGAKVFMADFEDSNSPTWANNIEGQINLRDAVDRQHSLHQARRQGLRARGRDRHADGASAGLAPAGEARHCRRRADLGLPVRLRPVLLPQRRDR